MLFKIEHLKEKNRINFNVCNIESNNKNSSCENTFSRQVLELSVKENYNYLINSLPNLGGSKKKTKSPKIHIGPRGGKYIKKKGKNIYINKYINIYIWKILNIVFGLHLKKNMNGINIQMDLVLI